MVMNQQKSNGKKGEAKQNKFIGNFPINKDCIIIIIIIGEIINLFYLGMEELYELEITRF